MSMENTKVIDFEIIKEPWNMYQIIDNSVLKTRTVLKKIERVMDGDKVSFRVDAQTLTVIYADNSLKGSPNTTPITKEDMVKHIDKSDMHYDTVSQEFNEYHLDDGTKIKIFTNVTTISRTTLKDQKGEPVYNIKSSNTVEIKPSEQYKQQVK